MKILSSARMLKRGGGGKASQDTIKEKTSSLVKKLWKTCPKPKLKFSSSLSKRVKEQSEVLKEDTAALPSGPTPTGEHLRLLRAQAGTGSAIGKESQLLQSLLKDQKKDEKIVKVKSLSDSSSKTSSTIMAKTTVKSIEENANIRKNSTEAAAASSSASSSASSIGLGVIRSDDSLALCHFKTALGSFPSGGGGSISAKLPQTAYRTAEDIRSSSSMILSKVGEKQQLLKSSDSLSSLAFKTAPEMSW